MIRRKNTGPLFFKPKRADAKKIPQTDVTVVIEKLSGEGRGIAFHNGKPLFIANTLPGEKVRVKVTLDKREYAEAELCEIVERVEQRITPYCELFGRCGGCALQMLVYADQLQHKSATLARILKAYIEILDQPIVAEPWHYRHRARFAIGDNNGKPVVGFKAANSHRVIEVVACVILDTRLQPLLAQLPNWLGQLTHWQRIEEIRTAIDSAGTIAMRLSGRRALPADDIALLTELCKTEKVSVEKNIALVYAVPSQNSVFNFSLDDFTQVNPMVNDQLVARVLEWLQLSSNTKIADFFCGLGNFTLPLAQYTSKVTGYEIDAAMVGRAAANAKNFANVEFRAVDLYASDLAVIDVYDAALLDPPRAGAKVLCEQLAKTKILQRIVYVSCNPQTLIRDIDILVRGGFRAERAALVDMFPQTGHIEAIVTLARG
jgi:23S rRNA (uracil1939-C5)-methyltransferase